ncbi:MAG: phage major capsid protein [Actinomycetota bacterium]|nr:phage major capsid protein [Actinomycetota bacterium]
MTIAELLERRDAILAELDDDNTPPERIAELDTESRGVFEGIESHNAAQARRVEMRGQLSGAQASPAAGRPAAPTAPAAEQRPQSLGQRFLDSPALTEFRNAGYTGTRGMDLNLDLRAVVDNAGTSGGAFQNPARPMDLPATNSDRAPRVMDLLDQRQTDSNTVEYVRDTSAAGGGGTAAEVAEGSAKPEATYTFLVVVEPVRTIAHWVPITRQAADDNAQLRGYIEGRLIYGLQFRIDSQIINGNGTAPNLRGILNVTGIGVYAPGAAEARVISIRKAITLTQIAEYAPTGVVLHPADWELVELSQDSQGMFRVNPNVANALAPRIWGLNVVPTTAIASGTGLVGDFKMGATWWDRQQTRVLISDSHSTFFTENKLAVLAEARGALAVWRPAAFAKITFNGVS